MSRRFSLSPRDSDSADSILTVVPTSLHMTFARCCQADSVLVDSSIEHIGGCYALDTSEGAVRNPPLFIKDAGSVEQGSSVLFFSYHVDAM